LKLKVAEHSMITGWTLNSPIHSLWFETVTTRCELSAPVRGIDHHELKSTECE